ARHPYFREALQIIFEWKKSNRFSAYIVPVRPEHFDHRISLQRGCFTFHVPNRHTLSSKENNTLSRFLIPATAKANIRKELFVLGVDEFGVYGDLESLSSRLKNAYGVKTN